MAFNLWTQKFEIIEKRKLDGISLEAAKINIIDSTSMPVIDLRKCIYSLDTHSLKNIIITKLEFTT